LFVNPFLLLFEASLVFRDLHVARGESAFKLCVFAPRSVEIMACLARFSLGRLTHQLLVAFKDFVDRLVVDRGRITVCYFGEPFSCLDREDQGFDFLLGEIFAISHLGDTIQIPGPDFGTGVKPGERLGDQKSPRDVRTLIRSAQPELRRQRRVTDALGHATAKMFLAEKSLSRTDKSDIRGHKDRSSPAEITYCLTVSQKVNRYERLHVSNALIGSHETKGLQDRFQT